MGGGGGRGLEPPTFYKEGNYIRGWDIVGIEVALSELSDSCNFSFYTKIIYKLYTHACNS